MPVYQSSFCLDSILCRWQDPADRGTVSASFPRGGGSSLFAEWDNTALPQSRHLLYKRRYSQVNRMSMLMPKPDATFTPPQSSDIVPLDCRRYGPPLCTFFKLPLPEPQLRNVVKHAICAFPHWLPGCWLVADPARKARDCPARKK